MKRQINNSDLNKAFEYGLIEANKWKQCSILTNKKGLEMQQCVISLLTCELFLKSILMFRGINITTIKIFKTGHEVYQLFRALPKNDQIFIENNIKFNPVIHVDMETGAFIKEYKNFDEALQKVSSDFIELRYEYEKFLNGESILVFNEFVSDLTDELSKFANGLKVNP